MSASLLHYLALLLLLGLAPAIAQEEEEAPSYIPSRYRITHVRLPAGPGAPQAAVSQGSYIVNFGSREGVQRGSVFSVRREGLLMGLVRVDQVWRDSAAVTLVALINKPNLQSPYPLEVGYYLEPKFVFLESIHFKSGEPEITLAMQERLRYAARFIRAYPGFPLILEGHTDNAGKEADNLKLSAERAGRIRDFLHEIHRLAAEQMHVKGYGEADPIATNDTESGRRRNRRVDLILADEVPGGTDQAAAGGGAPAPGAQGKGQPGRKKE